MVAESRNSKFSIRHKLYEKSLNVHETLEENIYSKKKKTFLKSTTGNVKKMVSPYIKKKKKQFLEMKINFLH